MTRKGPLLKRLYPELYHACAPGTWPQIRRLGLLSTERLVALAKVSDEQRELLLSQPRRAAERIALRDSGEAILRDQRPLSASKLAGALEAGMTVPEWLALLNGYVFLWPTRRRLETLLAAYGTQAHDVLVIDTSALLQRHGGTVRLSHMNTGATAPFAHPRGAGTFRPLDEFPLEQRRRSAGKAGAVAEVVVEDAIPDIADITIRVERYRGIARERIIWQRRDPP